MTYEAPAVQSRKLVGSMGTRASFVCPPDCKCEGDKLVVCTG